MKTKCNGKILKIYLEETDKWGHKPLYHVLIEKFKKEGLAGVTVLRGTEGFNLNKNIKTSHIFQLSEDLPLIIEVVDQAEKIKKILPEIKEMIQDRLITVEDVMVISYTADKRVTK